VASSLRAVELCSHSLCWNELDGDPRAARVFFKVAGREPIEAGKVCGAHADKLEKASSIVPGLLVERVS
jgi:hypothetical protein